MKPVHQHRCPTCGHRLGYLLLPSDVSAIRRQLRDGWPIAKLARAYQTTYSAIWRIKTRRTWKHIP